MNKASKPAKKIFESRLDCLEEVQVWIRQHAIIGGLSPPSIRQVELALEEAIVNIIQYAYPHFIGKIEISFKFYPRSQVEFQLKDTGPPFDPLQAKSQVDPDVSLEDREEGGLGILMMCKYMDQVHYDRKNGMNILTLIKKIYTQTN